MVVKTNLRAINTNRQIGIVNIGQQKHTEKLSSGYKINRAADDAAGLAISEKMRRQVRGLTRAAENAQDGVSFCQIADGALNEVHDMTKRLKQLSVQASNGTLCDTDREYLQEEVNQILKEINKVHETSVFNEMNIFSDSGDDVACVMAGYQQEEPAININVQWNFVDSTGSVVNTSASQATGRSNANNNSSMGDFVIKAAQNAAKKLQDLYPNLFSAGSSTTINIGLNLANIDGKGDTLASAALSMSSNGTSTTMSYSMNVDTSDYSVAGFDSMSDAQKADLAATISHEMTHLVMYDTLTDGMLSGRTGSFPKWLVEGMAQTSSGDGGWLSYSLSPSSSDSDITSYMSQLSSMPYGSGYLATMVLGLAASGTASATSQNIASGLDALLAPIANKTKTLDEMIAAKTSYTSLADFESKFKSGDAATLALAKKVLTARGTTGAGSLMGNLYNSQEDIFAPSKLTGTSSNYVINRDTTWMSNAFGSGYEFQPMADVGGGNGFSLQVGSEFGDRIDVRQFNVSSESIFHGAGIDVTTQELAMNSLSVVDYGDKVVSGIRAYYGAVQNRLEHTIKNLNNVVENTQAAESAIRDTDMATEMVEFSNGNIISQAGMSMLAQANQSNQNILSLLQ